jgi:hypothetical protein
LVGSKDTICSCAYYQKILIPRWTGQKQYVSPPKWGGRHNLYVIELKPGSHCGRDHMVVGFTTTYAISGLRKSSWVPDLRIMVFNSTFNNIQLWP